MQISIDPISLFSFRYRREIDIPARLVYRHGDRSPLRGEHQFFQAEFIEAAQRELIAFSDPGEGDGQSFGIDFGGTTGRGFIATLKRAQQMFGRQSGVQGGRKGLIRLHNWVLPG